MFRQRVDQLFLVLHFRQPQFPVELLFGPHQLPRRDSQFCQQRGDFVAARALLEVSDDLDSDPFFLQQSAIAYGVSATELITALRELSFSGWLVVFLTALMISEVYMVQGWYCAYLCPYGAITSILPTDGRQSYAFSDPEERCTGCDACVRICPIPGLDIRSGFDIRCIQCGLCEKACSAVFAKTARETLISCPPGSLLRAAGRGRGFLFALAATAAFSAAAIVYLADEARLDACRLENRHLHTPPPG